MSKKYDQAKPFQSIADASRTTGLSQYALRRGCKNGSLPHIRNGTSYLLNMRLLMEYLDVQSKATVSKSNA